MSCTIERRFHLTTQSQRRGGYRHVLRQGDEPAPEESAVPARPAIHPLARRMAMAIRCEQLLRSGAVADAAALAGIAHITRARMTQILNLTLLAPDIQEALLHLSPDAVVTQRVMKKVMAQRMWDRQRAGWRTSIRSARPCGR